MTWQWYETDKNGSHISAVSSLHTVNDPFEYGSELIDGNRKADISIPCPSDEVGTKYYRVVVTNYEPGGEYFTCESNVITVETLPAENRENLFEIDETGRLTRYLGFEDEVVIPSTIRGTKVTAIGNSFANGVNYPRVVIPEGVLTIEDNAFRDCFGLREVVLPNTLQSIGIQSFMRCGIISLTIPSGVQTIHKDAFKWAFTDLSEVTVNAESLTVNKGAFQNAYMRKIVFNCTTALTLDADIDTNPFNYQGCFDSCPNLYFFGFPESISVVTHANTIYDCPKLTWVDNYDSISGNDKSRGICSGQACCLIKSKAVRFGDWICIKDYNLTDKGTYASVSCGWSVAKKLWSSETSVTLPETLGGENVTGWGCGTFYSYGSRIIYSDMQTEVVPGCHVSLTDSPETLTEVILPETIRHISDYCAKGYSALTTVNFSECPNLSRIGMFAFEYCPLTGAFDLPGEYQRCSIGECAFKNTNLTSADLERAVLYPGAFNYCYQLTEVTGSWRVETENTVRELYNLIAPLCGSPYPVVFSFFFLTPAFPDSYNYTHYGKTKITDKNADYVSAITGYQIYRMYRTGKYWYSGTPDNAVIRYYVGYDDTLVTMPAMIYNMDQKQAYHIKTVKVCDHLPINNCMKDDYALTIQEGIKVIDGDFDRAYLVTLPEGLTSFTYKSFNDNKLLTEITIPSTITAISNGAFEYADNLANPLIVNLPGIGAKKMLTKYGSGTNSIDYEFDEVLIGYGGAAIWLNSLLEAEKEYYDNQFGISIRKLDEYVNSIYQKICTIKMFIDLSKENINAFLMKLDEAEHKNFKNCFDILPEEYKNSTAFAAKTNTGLTGKNSKAYAAALEEASDVLDGMMKKLFDFREKIKMYYTGAVAERKSLSTLDKIMKELNSNTPKAKFAQFAKGAAAGFGALMVIFDIISGLSTIVDAYDMYLGKINGNLYNQFGWMVSRLAAMPTGPYPGVYYDQYKACVHACFEYAAKLRTVRGYYTAAYYKEVVSFVITLTADIIGSVRPDIGLAVGITNWTLGNVSEIFTKGFAGLSEVAAGKLEDKVSDTCIGKKEEDDNDNSSSGGGGGSGKKQAKKKKIRSSHYIDPAGYVYEAVASNRVPGVTVTCYNKGSNGELLLWDASESGQENPLITDANGEYQWFVPIGDWRVVAEKEGYITSDSANDPAAVDGWLPVPPPQMEVYIPIVSTALPTVQSVQAGADYIRIEFSQYMDIDELTYYPELVTVTDNGVPVEVDRTFTDSEVSPTNSLKYYGRILTLSRHDGAKFSGDKLKVSVDKDFFNYAGNGMETSYESENLSVGQIAGTLSHSYPNRFAGSVGEEADIVIQVLDTSLCPMAGAAVNVEGSGSNTLLMPDSVVTDENGRAVFHTTAASSGYDTLTFSCGDASIDLETYVNPIGTVNANLSDFETVSCGTQLVISCATEGAVIRYTLDNSCPCDENALVYDGPITITDDVFVRMAAWTETGGYSERLNLHLKCEKEEELSFYGAALTLQNNLKVNFYAEKSQLADNGFTEPYAVFDMNGNTVTVSDYTEVTLDDVEYLVFSFSNIAPDLMNDTIRAVLHAKKSGEPVVGKELNYSISQYCYSTLGKTSDTKLRTLLVDLLNYGAAAQTYTEYKTDSLVNSGLTAEQRAWGTAADPALHSDKNIKYSTVDDPSVRWAGASLNLKDSITMQFVFTADSTDGVTVRIENENGAVLKEIASDEFVTSGGYYIAGYNGLTAGQMSDIVYVTAYHGDTKISNTVSYSIESYAFSKQSDENTKLADLVKAMMKYGNSAYSYAH